MQTEQWRPLRSAAPLSQGPTVIKNERFTDLQPKPTTSKKVSPLHGIYAEQYHHCTPITRRKGRKSWGLGGRETLALLRGRRFGCPNSPALKKSVTPSSMTDQQYHHCTPPTRRKGRKREGLGEREALALLRGRRFGCPNSPDLKKSVTPSSMTT